MTDCLKLALPTFRDSLEGMKSDSLFTALGKVFEEIRTRIRQIPLEANPGTATYTLPEWHDALGKKYNATLPVETQRRRLEAAYLFAGGMTIYQLQEQLDKEFDDITVAEVSASAESGVAEAGVSICGAVEGDYSPKYYDVAGTVANEEELAHLAAVLEHFASMHLSPCSSLTVLGLSATAEAGVGLSGVIELGYIPA